MKKFFALFLFALCACDMTTSSKVEGNWISRSSEFSILYEQTLTLNKDGSYSLVMKEEGKEVKKEEGSYLVEKQAFGADQTKSRVLSFTPSDKEVTPYLKSFALENFGYVLMLGTYNAETAKVTLQRFIKGGEQ